VPLYEYECSKCGRFEKIQKFSDKPLKVCPTCGNRKVERLLSAPAIQFKGSGWYITDYARSGGKPEGKAGDAKSGDSKGPGAKDTSESKPKKSAEKKTAASSGSSTKS
jgi:putative FmdB family regulatory protein